MRTATRFGAALATAVAALATAVAPAPAITTTATAAAAVPRSIAPAAVTRVAMAPAVPGARRFTGQITADVRQVIVVSASSWRSTTGVARLYIRSGSRWRLVATWAARLGYSGLVPGTRRVQGTGKTPAGVYPLTTAFGIASNPGSSLPYTRVNDDQWWVEDRTSAYYNQMRRASLGGFHVTTAGYNGSEHLARMGSQYDHVVVIDFNRRHPVVGRGAGIFLHSFGTGATAGCVAVSHAHMTSIMRWLKAPLHPRIIIGPTAWLNA
jgi:L,D-peptidoglycan transpeptidase YkuD (ErfK/YbiS/YcfS/YnhG family)